MDKEQRGSMILTFLEVNFPGGVAAFTESNGMVSHVPFKEDTVLIYHPNLPQSLIEKIADNNDRNHMPGSITILVVHDYNFKGMSPIEVKEKIIEAIAIIGPQYKIEKILADVSNPLVFHVLIFSDLNEYVINDICQTLTEHIPGIVRGLLSTASGKMFPFNQEATYRIEDDLIAIKPPNQKVTQPDQVIDNDAINDLKIALSGNLDVNDIINML